ncbi:MAG: hypothetical protein AABW81_04520 [Nanoarchaeota archaeon]
MINNKKIVLFVGIILILFLNIFLVSAVQVNPQDTVNDNLDKLEDTQEKVQTKWDYLGNEWQTVLLKNKFVSAVDGFLTKISFVFMFLFGEPYSLSLTLFMITVLWIYLFFQFSEVLRDFSAFSPTTSNIIGFGLAVILAQVGILKKIVEFFGWIVFSPEASWMRAIILILIIVVLVFLYRFVSALGKTAKKNREEMEKEKGKLASKKVQALAKGIEEGMKD